MPYQIHLAFRHMMHSDAVAEQINGRAAELERFFPQIVACHVAIEPSSSRQRKGKIYHLSIRLTVPGREIVVDRDPAEHHAHEDISVAVHDAFDAARRKLQDYGRQLRGDIKTHEQPTRGRVLKLFLEHGFIESADGSEIYMHRNSVIGGRYDDLNEGDEVRYVLHDGEGEKGPQASTVTPVGKHHPTPPAP